ncbi:hypothetical protein K435DRAFT_870346 [Dendrothele bispora CBS 962.96]|uniref:Uncharacterized protein n=1 Tax=Dendrothele bispora (strain CBS 962.96) TaxID=1314807 RepID=A0A4S8L783_DENBC|nr:hypothetical protein K435DRAFT_870346 [Dendrothele bispora CBS 962.96]
MTSTLTTTNEREYGRYRDTSSLEDVRTPLGLMPVAAQTNVGSASSSSLANSMVMNMLMNVDDEQTHTDGGEERMNTCCYEGQFMLALALEDVEGNASPSITAADRIQGETDVFKEEYRSHHYEFFGRFDFGVCKMTISSSSFRKNNAPGSAITSVSVSASAMPRKSTKKSTASTRGIEDVTSLGGMLFAIAMD